MRQAPIVVDEVTLVIPTLGRASLKGCLDAVVAGTSWPARLVMVDQGRNDESDSWARELVSRGISVDHVRSTQRGTAAAMNRALERVETSLVAVTHDDCRVHPRWLELMADRLRTEGSAIVTGQVRPEDGKRVVGSVTSETEVRHERPLLDRDPLFPDNMGFPLAVARRLGPFDEDERLRFAEDAEWSYRALRAGIPILYAPELVVTHLAARDALQRAATYRNYARSQGGFYGKYLRQLDAFIALRTGRDLLRGLWMVLRGTVERDPDVTAYGRAYVTALPAGLMAGLRKPR